MGLPKYLSETLTIGPRTYLIEVKKHSRGQKYMIITRTDLRDNEQQPVIVFDRQMTRFMRIMEQAAAATLTTVSVLEDTANRKHTGKVQERKKKAKANPPEFCNAGKRWTEADDKRLTEQFQNGVSMEALMKMFKRRSGSIEVRMYKLGLLPVRDG